MMSLVFFENVKNSKNLMKIVSIEEKDLYIFWTTCGISVKITGKRWLMAILKVMQNQGVTLKNALLEKP